VNPYFFAVGCPRSGTTLLKRLLDAHSEIAVPAETHWIPRMYEAGTVAPDGTVGRDILEALWANPRFEQLGLDRVEVWGLFGNDERMRYADLVTAVFDLYGRRREKRLVGDKTPNYARHIPRLSGLWPNARFIHIIRDGRSVALSLMNWERQEKNVARLSTWNRDPVGTAALYWEWNVRLAREDGIALGPGRYREILYEHLTEDPATVCAELCAFLDVDYDEAMVRYHEGKQRNRPGLSVKRSWAPVTAGLRDWRVEMSAPDVEWFEALSGPLLEELGYERPARGPAPEGQAAAVLSARATFRSPAPGFHLPSGWTEATSTATPA
jgi:hypothetical protein